MYSNLFSKEIISASFDALIERDAANGRINGAFIGALEGAYGLALPASPAKACTFIGAILGAEKAPRIGKGAGSRANAVEVCRALSALHTALHQSGRVKGLKAPLPLPLWACPNALAKAKAEKAKALDKAKAEKANALALAKAEKAKATQSAATAPDSVPGKGQDLNSAVALVIAAARQGALSSAQKGALISALEGAMVSA